MRVLFTTRPGVGHLYPLLPLARAATDAGHAVLVAAPEVLRREVEGAGLDHAPTGHDNVDIAPWVRSMPPDQIRPRVFGERFASVETGLRLPSVRALVESWQPDIVVHEVGEFAAAIAATAAGLPHVTVSFGPMVPDEVLEIAGAAAAVHWRAAGLEPQPKGGVYTHLYLDICPPSLQAVVTQVTSRRLLRPIVFGSEGPPVDLGPLPRPVAYITMGTAFGREADVFKALVEGVLAHVETVVVTVGRFLDPADLGPQPANVKVHSFIPQAQLLPQCDLVVTHGGSGSMLGALAAGLPLLMIPQGADQFYNAERVLAAGAGLVIGRGDLSPQVTTERVARLLEEPGFRARARDIQAEIAVMPSPAETVAALEGLVSGGAS